jgi:hypothetical protein
MFLKATLPDWGLFDGEYTSFEAGMIKPELGFYQHVIDSLNLADPKTAIFVDDKVANVNAAQSFGLQGIVFESGDGLIRQLRNQLFDPVIRARQYMEVNAHKHHSQIENGPHIRDAFSQFLIHKELQDTSVISLSPATASPAQKRRQVVELLHRCPGWHYTQLSRGR